MGLRYIEKNGRRFTQVWVGGQGEPPLKGDEVVINKNRFDELAPSTRNTEGLLGWLYGNSDYQSLMNTHGGIVAAFERQIAENRYPLALQLWNQLPVPETLLTQLFAADGPLVQNGYQDLIDFVNQ